MGWRGNDISNPMGSPPKESREAVRAVLTGRGCCVGTQGVSGAVMIPGSPSLPRHFSLGTSLPPSSDPKAKRSVCLASCSDKWAGANKNSLCPSLGPCCRQGPGADRSCACPAPQGLFSFPRIILLFYVYLMNTVIWQNVAVRHLWVPVWATQHRSVRWLQKSAEPQSISHERWCQPHRSKICCVFPTEKMFHQQ